MNEKERLKVLYAEARKAHKLRYQKWFEAGWRACREAAVKQDMDSAKRQPRKQRQIAYCYSAQDHRELEPPAAQSAEEGKHGHR